MQRSISCLVSMLVAVLFCPASNALEESSSSTPPAVCGAVHNASDQPIGRAAVTLFFDDKSLTTETDDKGLFALSKIPETTCNLLIEATGFIRYSENNILTSRSKINRLEEISLSPGLFFSGTVLKNGTKDPVKDATVRAFAKMGENHKKIAQWGVGAITDASGAYKIDGLQPGMIYDLVASATGCSVETRADLIAGTPKIDFALNLGASLSGYLHERDGSPVKDVTLELTINEDAKRSTLPSAYLKQIGTCIPQPARLSLSAVSKGDGSFAFDVNALGKYILRAKRGTEVALSSVKDNAFTFETAQEVKDVSLTLVEGAILSGVVNDSESAGPIAGASVTLKAAHITAMGPVLTDASGAYRFCGLDKGTYSLILQSKGYLKGTKEVDVTKLEPITVTVSLDRALTVAGRVVNEASKPVEDALVELRDAADSKKKNNTITDSTGRFEFSDLKKGRAKLLSTTGEYATTVLDNVEIGAKDLTLVLKKGGVIEAKAQDASGLAVESVTITLKAPSEVENLLAKTRLVGLTNPKGICLLKGLDPGLYRVEAHTNMLFAPAQKDVTVELGETTSINFVMKPGVSLKGRVVTEKSAEQKGVKGAMLKAGLSEHDLVREATTDEDGDFILEKVPAGTAKLALTVDKKYISKNSVREVVVGDEDIDGIEFVVELGSRVYGFILGPTETGPISGAAVSIGGKGMARMMSAHKDTTTDATGYYEFNGLETLNESVLRASAKDYASAQSKPFSLAKGEMKEVTLTLTLGGSVSGTVTDASGEPVVDVNIRAGRSVMEFGNQSQSAKTDPYGKYKINSVETGQISVMCEPPASMAQKATLDTISQMFKNVLVREGQETENVNFQFKIKDADSASKKTDTEDKTKTEEDEKNSHIYGRVVDANEKPIANVSIQAMPANFARGFGTGIESAKTDAQGNFKIENISAGKYNLMVNATERFGKSTVPAQAPEDNLVITLKGKGAISGKVVYQTDGKPVTEFSLTIDEGSPNLMNPMGLFGADKKREIYSPYGEFTLRDLDAGDYKLTASVKGYADSETDLLTVEPAKTTDNVIIEIGHGGTVTGIVLSSADENPIPGAKVRLEQKTQDPRRAMLGMAESDERSVMTNDEGLFTMDNLSPGTATLIVTHPEFSPSRKSGISVVDAEESASVIIYLGAPGWIEGHVYGEDNQPLVGQQVTSMVMDRGTQQSVETDELGSYQIRGLEPGSYTLMLGDLSNFFFKRAGISNKTAIVKEGEKTVVDFGQPAALVYGTVTREGQPVSGAQVSVRTSDMPFGFDFNANAESDEKGFYRISGLEKGHYYVMLFDRAFSFLALDKVTIDILEDGGAHEANLSFPQTFVAGQIISATDGAPIPRASASLSPSGGGYAQQVAQFMGGISGTSSADGRFVIKEVPSGKYQLLASADGYGQETVDVEVFKGQSVDGLSVQLGGFGILEGEVRDATTNQPIAAFVELKNSNGNIVADNRDALYSSDKGHYRIDRLSPGTYKVVAMVLNTGGNQQYAIQTIPDVEIRSKETTTVNLSMEQGGIAVVISYVDPDGKPITQLTSHVFSETGQEMSDASFVVGSSVQCVLSRGKYRIETKSPGFRPDDMFLDLTNVTDYRIPKTVTLQPE